MGLQMVVVVLLSPHPECLAEAEEDTRVAGRAEWCQRPTLSALSLLSLRGGTVTLRGWTEAPQSSRLQGRTPGAQGRPVARAAISTLFKLRYFLEFL